jgi:hypothetical protein
VGRLNAERVNATFMHCLLQEDEDPSEQILVGGLGHVDRLHAGRVAASLQFIREMLAELPDESRTSEGIEFEAAGVDRAGDDWVSETSGFREMTIERLVQLGVAAGKVVCEQPCKRWDRYPSFKVKR